MPPTDAILSALSAAANEWRWLAIVWHGVLVAVVLAALVAAASARTSTWRSVRADHAERVRPLPGDGVIADPLGAFTHAITIHRDVREVWPWLVQMGAGTRAGWYSYDWLDNGRRPSARRIVPEFQHANVGSLFPALPGVRDGFNVLQLEPERTLVLGWTSPGGEPHVTWAFVLEPRANDTRLIVRVRGARDYRFHGLPRALSTVVIRAVHFVMQRRQLLGIAGRAESLPVARILV